MSNPMISTTRTAMQPSDEYNFERGEVVRFDESEEWEGEEGEGEENGSGGVA